MAFNRDDAVNYAKKHWNIPCHDGVFWLSNEAIVIEQWRKRLKAPAADGWEPMFVDDGKGREKAVFRRTVGSTIEEKLISPWEGIADCAHYLSLCLTAGGAKINERGVTGLVNTLQERGDTKTLCERVERAKAQQVIDTGIPKKGDMVGYFNVSPDGDYGGRLAYAHSTMYVGKIDSARIGGVTCHTICRFPPLSWVNDSWWLHDGYTYTIIHWSVDDPAPDPAKAAALEGWWRLDYSGRTEYYLINKGGSARYTKKAPKTNKDVMHAPEGSAYWFMAADKKITFVWRKTGTVEVWTPGAGNSYSSMINGATPGTLAKL
ncbi:MAG: hypothetical protein HY820_14355 [Acidobacteria bacterium]|nr:hypothetical protein [Acidobacteriota bacterium]